MITDDELNRAMAQITEKRESYLLEQLGELVTKGLILIESTEPVLVESDGKFEIRSAVRLVLRDREIIEEMRTERDEWKQRAEKLFKALQREEHRCGRLDGPLKDAIDYYRASIEGEK